MVAVVTPAGIGSMPLWMQVTGGNVTLPRDHRDDSDVYNCTPGVGVDQYSYFVAQTGMIATKIRFATGRVAPDASATAQVSLYTVNPISGALTRVATTVAKALSGANAAQVFTLAASFKIQAGVLYAIGLIQVGTTPASLLGSWFGANILGGTPPMAMMGSSGLSALPASVTPAVPSPFPVYYEVMP